MTQYRFCPRWIGLADFRAMFIHDPYYFAAVGNTLYYSILAVPLTLIVALGLALLLNQRWRGIGIFRTIYYLPSLVNAVAGTLLWMLMLDPRGGVVNSLLHLVGLPRLGWLESVTWSKPALIIMHLWTGSGAPMLIFLAALKDTPQSLIDAALIYGADAWQRFRHVVLPLLTPTIFFNLVMGIVSSFQVFTTAFVASARSGGGARRGHRRVSHLEPGFAATPEAGLADCGHLPLHVGLERFHGPLDLPEPCRPVSDTGIMISLPMWRHYLKPRRGRVFAVYRVARPDIILAYHSCGSIRPLIPELIELGMDVLSPIQVTARDMEPAWLKAQFGSRLAFCGGVDQRRVLPLGSPKDAETEVLRRTAELGAGSGYILAPTHDVQSDPPVANVLAIFEAVQKHSRHTP